MAPPECRELPYSGEFSWAGTRIFLGSSVLPSPQPSPVQTGEGQRVREGKNEENAQIGRPYTDERRILVSPARW